MEYVIYLDVQFLTELSANLLLLVTAGRLLKRRVSFGRCAAAAAAGALAHTAVLAVHVLYGWRLAALLPVPGAVLMLKLAFGLRGTRELVRAAAVFYGTAFCMAGAMQYINPGQRRTLTVFVLSAAGAYGVLWGLCRLLQHFRRKYGNICQVRLYIGEEVLALQALADTGNSLKDPWYKKPVNIIEQSALAQISGRRLEDLKPHMIPYSSIGKKNGLLMGIVIPKMVIGDGEDERTIEEPVLAVSRAQVSSDNRYRMILHEEYMHN